MRSKAQSPTDASSPRGAPVVALQLKLKADKLALLNVLESKRQPRRPPAHAGGSPRTAAPMHARAARSLPNVRTQTQSQKGPQSPDPSATSRPVHEPSSTGAGTKRWGDEEFLYFATKATPNTEDERSTRRAIQISNEEALRQQSAALEAAFAEQVRKQNEPIRKQLQLKLSSSMIFTAAPVSGPD